MVLKDIMESRQYLNSVSLQYCRIPITAEDPPDYGDLKDLIEVVLRSPPNTPIVVNCQLGRGRSTLASVRAVPFSIRLARLRSNTKFFFRLFSYSSVSGCKSTGQRPQLRLSMLEGFGLCQCRSL